MKMQYMQQSSHVNERAKHATAAKTSTCLNLRHFSDSHLQVLLPVGLGRLGQILGLRVGELCEVYGGPASGKTQLGLTVAACAAQESRPVLFVTVKVWERVHGCG